MTDKTLLVQGGSTSTRERVTATAKKVLSNNFTLEERRNIGAVVINLSRPGLSSSLAADTGVIPLPKGMVNPGRRGITEIRLSPDVRNVEQSLTHEMLHAMYRGEHKQRTDERRIDFEVMSRLSMPAVKKATTGYYYGDTVKFPSGTSMDRKVRFVKGQIVQDRRTLTGSLNKSIQGRTAQRRADKLFHHSMFARKPRFQ